MLITNEVTNVYHRPKCGGRMCVTNAVDLLSPTKVPVDCSVGLLITYLKAQSENPVLGHPNLMVMNFFWGIWSYYTAVK